MPKILFCTRAFSTLLRITTNYKLLKQEITDLPWKAKNQVDNKIKCSPKIKTVLPLEMKHFKVSNAKKDLAELQKINISM